MTNDPRLLTVSGWVGRSHADLDCWELVREAFRLRDVKLHASYHEALLNGMFRTVFEPEPWDLVPISNHRLEIVNHVALYLGDGQIIHSIEDAGVVLHPLTREPWFSRIARERAGDRRKGFLRLRA
jgi:cell wall-associated NlpC family hydrolase